MSILKAENLSLSFGDFDLFRGVSLSISDGRKIGLIGPNGAGKTSLLLILAGLGQPTTGKVHLARGRRLGYLRQEAMETFADRDNTVFAEMLAAFADLTSLQERLNHMEARMAAEYTDELLAEYGELQERFALSGGYDFEIRIQQTLQGLGLGKEAWDKPLTQLSGGQKTRALLARLLLEKPDLLMLDEPTNHLDVEAVEWLERTLNTWEGAVLIVSHDRYFLDNVVDAIWDLTPDGIETYPGNYSAYLLQREERWAYYERVFTEEKARLEKEADFIQRNWVRASTHARAMGLLRRLSRDLALVDACGIMALRSGKKWSEFGLSVERPLDPLEALRKVKSLQLSNGGGPARRPPRLRPRLASSGRSGEIVLRAGSATVGYPGHPLFTIQDVELRRGERVALLGANGTGKTTFLKTMLGEIGTLEGEVRLGASLKIGYLAQANDALTGEGSVLDELLSRTSMQNGAARSYLAQYLFMGDEVFKPVSALSGGERARLALAILSLDGANFLILDEPTNHLDIPAQEALQEVLENFSGTVLLVSHDRYLINRLATQIWELHAGQLHVFQGGYREWALRQANGSGNGQAKPALLLKKSILRVDDKETRKRVQAMDRLEEDIQEQEATIRHLSGELQKAGAGNGKGFEHLHQLSWKVAKAQARLEELMAEWEKLAV
jgi:ATP-binding cassette, subfamily F, member 3